MKAAIVKGPGLLSVEEVPTPKAGPGGVVIKVRYCGICGSDVRMFPEGFFPPGFIMGHEFSGEIFGVGPGVEGWAMGDRVTAMPALTCGTCHYCRLGETHHCQNLKILGMHGGLQGAFAEYVGVNASMLRRLPDAVTDEEGANIEPCAVSLRAVRRSGMRVGDSVAIFGAGSIGLFVLQCARLAGASAVYVIEPVESRAKAATLLGADRILDPSKADVSSEIAGLTLYGADVAFVCTAAPPVLEQAVGSVRPQGRVMVVGGGMTATVMPEHWMWKEVEVGGSFAYIDEFDMALALFKRRSVRVEGMISRVIPLEGLGQALMGLAKPSDQIKVLVQPGQTG